MDDDDMIPFVSMADFKEEEVKEIYAASNLWKLTLLSCKESDIRQSYIAKKKKEPLPFNLNLKPRTYRKPRSTPIDMRSLLPYLHQMRKSEDSQPSQELASSSTSSQSSRKLKLRLPDTQHSQELGSLSSSSQGSRKLKLRLPDTQHSQELGFSSSSSQSSRKLKLRLLSDTQYSQELGSSSSSSQGSKKLRLTIRVKPESEEPELLPLEFKKKIAELGGSDIKLLFVKTLFTCDVNSSKSRLTMPYKQCKFDLGDVNKVVKVIYRPDDEVKEMMMKLKKWDTVSSYVFNGSWNSLVSANNLKEEDVVQVWCFRIRDELSFALVKL